MARYSKTGVRGLHRGPDGRLHIDLRWREPSTGEARRYTERLPTGIAAAAAKQRAREILSAAFAGGFDPKRQTPRRLGEALDDYEKWAVVHRPLTIKSRKSLSKILRDGFGDIKLDDISPFHVERFKRARTVEEAKPATINRAVAQLKHLLGLAASWGWMMPEKARAVRAVKLLKEGAGRVRYLLDDEEKRLFAEIPKGIRPLVLTALMSGMRLGEIVSLRKDAVDVRARLITLTRTKSGKVRRLPINDALSCVLELAISISPSLCEYVFISRLGKRYSRDAVTRIFHRAVVRAEIQDLRFHDLRHDYATRLRRKGVGIDAIAELLGHSNLAVTQRYAHIEMNVLREAVAGFDRRPNLSAIAEPLPAGDSDAAQKAK